MVGRPTLLVVDDVPANVRLLRALLTPHGYSVVTASSGEEALQLIKAEAPDLLLLDVMMPGIDGYEVCERLRAEPATERLPIVMITATAAHEKTRAIEAGADDFIQKPFDEAELLARVRSLLRIKSYHDTIQAQAAQLAEWNADLEERVRSQVDDLERLSRLRRFLSPQLAELIVTSGDETLLESHRREITVVSCDLRGFTHFAETAEPEEVMGLLREYHAVLGKLIFQFEGTLERFAGDGLLVFFNDPVPCPDPAARAVTMSMAMREQVGALCHAWRRRGHDLGFGVGVAMGYATLGKIGFEGRFDYGAIGTVTNLSSRLCADALAGQILVSQRVFADVEGLVEAEPVGELVLKGFLKPVPAFNLVRLKSGQRDEAGLADPAWSAS
jgi:class 3 adenylate cyclase/CheY-like chemotaxis protein